MAIKVNSRPTSRHHSRDGRVEIAVQPWFEYRCLVKHCLGTFGGPKVISPRGVPPNHKLGSKDVPDGGE
jgi:hypothetical protein